MLRSGAERWIAYIQWIWSIYYMFLLKPSVEQSISSSFPKHVRECWAIENSDAWNYCATRMSAKGLQRTQRI